MSVITVDTTQNAEDTQKPTELAWIALIRATGKIPGYADIFTCPPDELNFKIEDFIIRIGNNLEILNSGYPTESPKHDDNALGLWGHYARGGEICPELGRDQFIPLGTMEKLNRGIYLLIGASSITLELYYELIHNHTRRIISNDDEAAEFSSSYPLEYELFAVTLDQVFCIVHNSIAAKLIEQAKDNGQDILIDEDFLALVLSLTWKYLTEPFEVVPAKEGKKAVMMTMTEILAQIPQFGEIARKAATNSGIHPKLFESIGHQAEGYPLRVSLHKIRELMQPNGSKEHTGCPYSHISYAARTSESGVYNPTFLERLFILLKAIMEKETPLKPHE